MKAGFEEIWTRICSLEGESFETKTGLAFTYTLDGEAVIPSRTQYRLGKNEFAKAYEQLPLDGPGPLNSLVRGPAYVWAILRDKRLYT